jgi:CRP-like cAMP-binding protein
MFKEFESVPLLKDLDDSILRLLDRCLSHTVPYGPVIFEQGEPARYLYLILAGAVEMLYKPYDGPQLTLTNLTQGSIIGWSAVVGNAAYTSGAVCKEDCTAIRMTGRDLQKLCVKEPEAGRIILDLLNPFHRAGRTPANRSKPCSIRR